RDADQQGLNGWNNALVNGTLTRTQVAKNFETSIEYMPTLIDRLYQRYLFRRADVGGASYWTSQLLNVPAFTLEDLIGNLTGSAEHCGTPTGINKSTCVQLLYNAILGR